MKHSLQLKLSQHLTLTPQLQQSIKLLQLSTIELNQELEKYLLENPLLERIDAASDSGESMASFNGAADYSGTPREENAPAAESAAGDSGSDFAGSMDDGISYSSSTRRQSDDDEDSEYSQLPAAEPTLQEHLINQLTLSPLAEHDRRLALMLIAHLDDDGYLTYDLDDLAALIAEHIEMEPAELAIALRHVQNMEPTGVGARSLGECLALQLRALPAGTPQLDRAMQLAETTV